MKSGGAISILVCAAMGAAGAHAQNLPPPPPPNAASIALTKPVELDHVVAMIGNNVILQSDVELEMHLAVLEPLRIVPGEDTPVAALRRLIDRTLILEQMKDQQQSVSTPAAEVEKAVVELRKQIPGCAKYHCETAQGWEAFLKANDLTAELVARRWGQRMAILHFIDLRFRSGIKIPPDQIAAYYQKTLVPALRKGHQEAPPLAQVSGRIQELLLQQQVSGLFQDWLSSLRDQGNVQIVDPAYTADWNTTNGNGNTDNGSDTGPGQ
jgi:hypothetical protein